MTTGTIDRIGTKNDAADGVADLRNTYLEAAAEVAALDLGDARLWRRIDAVVAQLAAAAYGLTSILTGQPARHAAAGVPPVVRARELATAQRQLFGVLDRYPSHAGPLVDEATDQGRQLVRLLRNVTLSTQRTADRGDG